MQKNKTRDMTPYAMPKEPGRQNPALLPLIWAAGLCALFPKWPWIKKVGTKGLKPPYLVLAQHQGFTDYYIAPLALFPHRASYVSDVEGFANFGNSLYSQIGCIPTRRFTYNPTLVPSIRHVVTQNKDILVMFPEARHSNVGTASPLQDSVAKLVRLLGIPVVVLKTSGSYLTRPIWDEKHRRKSRLAATLELALTPEQIATASNEEITTCLNKHFQYDEYRWQLKNHIAIPYPHRACGLHHVLYQCPHCKVEHYMNSTGCELVCLNCEKQWKMDEYGQLVANSGPTEYSHIPDWYEFQREQVALQIRNGHYHLHVAVMVDALPNQKGFVPMGSGLLRHTPEGFFLTVPSADLRLRFATKTMPSVHTEYNYRGQGNCVVLSTKDCCYYLYPQSSKVNITKIQFAAEHFYNRGNS